MAALKNFLGLIVLFMAICVLGGLTFVVFSIVSGVTDTTKKKMEKKNISFSKEGMQVKMKHRTAEQESDAAQNVLTKVWSAASTPTPGAQSKSWWGSDATQSSAPSTPAGTPGVNTEKRKPFSRSASSQQSVKKS